jgi:selenocysteine lyase/cysteine desulfurase
LAPARADRAYEAARATVQRSLNAAHREEIVFVRGTTEAIKLVAHCYGRPNLRPGDEGRWKTDTRARASCPVSWTASPP